MSKVSLEIQRKILLLAKKLLKGRESFSLRKDNCRAVNGDITQYYVTLSAIDSVTLSIHELITPQGKESFQDYFWLFKKVDGHWSLQRALINGAGPDETLLERELYDLFVRLTMEEEQEALKVELPEETKGFNRVFNPYIKRLYSYVYLLIGSALLVFGLFATLFVSNIQYNRMARIVNTLDRTISSSAEGNDYVIEALSEQISQVTSQIDLLMEVRKTELEAFHFSRYNMSTSIRSEADRMSNSYQYSMKRAYYYLADLVENSSSYGELYYHFSRLPENNSQAETLLATDRENIIALNEYEQAIDYFLFPVRQDGGENNGEGFMVSCGYMDMRLSPLGEGGFRPHYAIDIINIDNIINITEQSGLNREGKSGAIVAPAEGIVLDNNYSESYGWFMEVEHPIREEIARAYPGITRLTTFYAHMEERSNWERGDLVEANEKLGNIGNTGVSTGPHLHYEIRIYSETGGFQGYLGESFQGIEPMTRRD